MSNGGWGSRLNPLFCGRIRVYYDEVSYLLVRIGCLMKQTPYVVSFQKESFYKGTRFHWMVCCSNAPDQLVSWGHAPTQEMAETAAQMEVKDLSSGMSHGGRVPRAVKPFHNC